MNPSRSPAGRSRTITLVIVGIVFVAAALRIAGADGDLWLDEVWSLRFARQAQSSLELLTDYHHDNNHILNTLWLYWLGDQADWRIYRILAVLTGTLAVAVGAASALRRSRIESLLAATLLASSYLLVLYSSEARGYAPAILFALLAWHIIENRIASGGIRHYLVFISACVMGFLAHLTFIHAYTGMLVWSAFQTMRSRRSAGQAILRLLRWHLVPLAFLCLLYAVHIRHIFVAGGPRFRMADLLSRTISLIFGGPESGAGAWLVTVGAAMLFAAALYWLRRTRSDHWVFYIVAIALSPLVLIMFLRPEFLYVRYFLVSAAFLLLLIARLLAASWRWGTTGRAFCVITAGLICAGNLHHLRSFFPDRRGHYHAALQYMAEKTNGAVITIGSDNDLQNGLLLEFYSKYLPPEKRLAYVPIRRMRSARPEWLIARSFDRNARPETEISNGSLRYRLVAQYRFAARSGQHWFVYRRRVP